VFLDGPTTGLHFSDIEQLLKVLQKFVDNGNTVVIIEHNMDIIRPRTILLILDPTGEAEGVSYFPKAHLKKLQNLKILIEENLINICQYFSN